MSPTPLYPDLKVNEMPGLWLPTWDDYGEKKQTPTLTLWRLDFWLGVNVNSELFSPLLGFLLLATTYILIDIGNKFFIFGISTFVVCFDYLIPNNTLRLSSAPCIPPNLDCISEHNTCMHSAWINETSSFLYGYICHMNFLWRASFSLPILPSEKFCSDLWCLLSVPNSSILSGSHTLNFPRIRT